MHVYSIHKNLNRNTVGFKYMISLREYIYMLPQTYVGYEVYHLGKPTVDIELISKTLQIKQEVVPNYFDNFDNVSPSSDVKNNGQ